jgi:glycosidase
VRPSLVTRGAVLFGAFVLLAASGCKKASLDRAVLHVPSPAWEEQIIYFVMTDRFADGDPGNDDQGKGEFDPAVEGRYSGGDLQGIIDKLDYIQGLGATAVWITPPVANMWWDPLQQYGGYHGYWARNLKQVDEHLGTLATFQALSKALHARGMYLIQDVVPNHMGNYFQYTSYDPANLGAGVVLNTAAVPTSKPTLPPFDQCDPTDPAQRAAGIYHWTPAISNYSDPVQEKTWQVSDLDDLNTENPVVRTALRDAYGYWIKEVGVDAFRVDTVKFAPVDFWNDFFHSTEAAAPGMLAVAKATGRSDFFAFGEVFEVPDPMDDAADRKVVSYLGTPSQPALPSVLGFPLYAEIGRVFAQGKPTAYMRYRLERLMDPTLYPDPYRVPNFIDNHDVRRFLAVGSGQGFLQALAFLYTVPGIPVVYQGTEQGFTETRAAMFQGGYHSDASHFNVQGAVYLRLKKLAAMRRANPALVRGDLQVLASNPAGPGVLAYRRTLDGQVVLVLANTADEQVLVNGLDTGLPAGTVLESLYDEEHTPVPVVGAAGKVQMVLPARGLVVARATAAVTTPPSPLASITVTTPIEGQTFTTDVVLSGSVSPPATALKLVLDGYLARATDVPVAADGTWSVTLPVSLFPSGLQQHVLAFYAPVAGAASADFHFSTNATFSGTVIDVPDPLDDDLGPAGTYTYPSDSTFLRQMDVTGVTLEVGATTLNVKVSLRDWSTTWNPPNGFDHVCFNLYWALPAGGGTDVMPMQNATTPLGFTWNYRQFAYGWDNAVFSSVGASASANGTPVPAAVPAIKTNPSTKTVVFTYDRNALGLATWSGVKLYLTTWDFDGIGGGYRPLLQIRGPWAMGGGPAPYDPSTGESAGPKIMDQVGPISIP